LDLDILSDHSESYSEPWGKSFQEIYKKNYLNQNFIQTIHVGETHTVVSSQGNKIYSYGLNDWGQLGQE